jgi:hypothetical protein
MCKCIKKSAYFSESAHTISGDRLRCQKPNDINVYNNEKFHFHESNTKGENDNNNCNYNIL